MKRNQLKRSAKSVIGCIAAATILAGCAKLATVEDAGQYSMVYMPQANEDLNVKNLIISPTPDTVYFGTAFGGFEDPKEDIVCEFELLSGAVATYNEENYKNYEVLPADSYTISGLTSTIRQGQSASDALKIAVNTEHPSIDTDKEYMLVVRLKSITGNHVINEDRRVTYFVIKASYKSLNRSDWEVVEFDSEETRGEGSNNGRAIHAIDGNYDTYWHTQYDGASPTHPHHIVIDLGDSHSVHALNIYGQAGWAPGRPELVEVLLSDDQQNWESSGDFEVSGHNVMNTITFSDNGHNSLTGRYMKLVIKRSFDNQFYTAIAEIEAY